jgi:hypothetical protein
LDSATAAAHVDNLMDSQKEAAHRLPTIAWISRQDAFLIQLSASTYPQLFENSAGDFHTFQNLDYYYNDYIICIIYK